MRTDTDTLQAGVAEAVIPAEPGLDLAGFVARENPALGKRDEIYARALALSAGERLLLLLTADVLGFEARVVRALREEIARRLRDSGEEPASLSVTVAATHTHSAPASMPLRNCGAVSAPWLREAVAVLADVALRAARNLQPARLGVGAGAVRGVAGNRRTPGFPEAEGTPLDPELGVIRVETAGGAPLACVVNFTCHPVILGHGSRDISADYPGLVAACLRDRLGAVTLVTNGATGDINPRRRDTWEDVEHLAGAVIAEAERVWAATRTAEVVPLGATSETLALPLLPLPPRADLEAAAARFRGEQEAAGQGTAMRVADAYRQWAEEALALPAGPPDAVAEVQALRLGDAALVAVPGEFFVELGLRVKQRLAEQGVRPTFLLGYTNGNIGYIPTRAAYPAGGYEVETAHRYYGHACCVAPEAGERIVERAVALAAGEREAKG